jgi:hypothetical protein
MGVLYEFSTTTTDSDPGAGKLRLSSATQDASTVIRADLLDLLGNDWTAFLDTLDDSTNTNKGYLELRHLTNPAKWIIFKVSSVASPSGYRNITVVPVDSSATSPFANTDQIVLHFAPAGDVGASGAGGGSMDGGALVQSILGAPDTGFDFDTSSLTGLTSFNSPDILDADTTVPDCLYIQDNESGQNVCGVYATAPSAPFTVIAGLRAAGYKDSNAVTLGIGDGTPGAFEQIGIQNEARNLLSTRWNSPTSFSGTITTHGVGAFETPLYLAIRVHTITNVDFLASADGITWFKLTDSRDPSMTPAVVLLAINANATGDELGAAWDFLYIYNSALTLPGVAA